MQTLDYLVIFHDNNSMWSNSTKELPITITIDEEANAKEKYLEIKERLKIESGIHDIKLIGIFKL